MMEASVGEVVVPRKKVAWAEVEAAELATKSEEEAVVEEGRPLQVVVVPVLPRLVEEGEEQVGQRFRLLLVLVVEAVAAYPQPQHWRLGRRSLSGEVVEDQLNVQAAEAGPKEHACPRKVVER